MIYAARAAYRAQYAAALEIIEPPKWPLPDAQERGVASTKAAYMTRSAKGTGSNSLLRAPAESNFERDCGAAHDYK